MNNFRRDEGVYAILYAALIVAFFGIAALVVDTALLRADKRDSRSAADFAALAGASELGSGPYTPQKACVTAWEYALQSLRAAAPSSTTCANPPAGQTAFPTSVDICPQSANSVSATDGEITIAVTWPIPDDYPALTLPDGLASGTRTGDSAFDGTNPCYRLAVTITRARTLGLGAAIGLTRGSTTSRSVSLYTFKPGSNGDIAALNVLNLTQCQTLTTGGQGDIVVNRALDLSKGVIAVESAPNNCSNNKYVIDLSSNNNNRICASGPAQVPDGVGSCDGLGTIAQHALDSASTMSTAYPGAPNAVTASFPLAPRPIPERGVAGWAPVTRNYGCSGLPSTATSPGGCAAYPPYMRDLYTAMDSPTPAVYTGVGTYGGVTYGAFQTLSNGTPLGPLGGVGTFACAQGNNAANQFYVPAGNWYANCPDANNQPGFRVSTKAIFGGGQIVFAGGVTISNEGGCFTVNTPVPSLPATPNLLSCPTTTVPPGQEEQATTDPAPSQEARVFIRGSQGFTTGANNTKILLPQTLVVQGTGGLLNLGGGGGTLLWTAPGAGAVTGGRSTLEQLCSSSGDLDQTCMDSHFSKTAYWNETFTTGNQILSIKGQSGLSLVGVYFAPRGDFTFSGQGSFYATNAQYWVDTLGLSGDTTLALTPDPSLSFERPTFSVSLIR